MAREALFIGTTQYSDPLFKKLTAPTADVAELHALLTSPQVGDFVSNPPLLNRPAAELLVELEAFFEGRARSDLLVLYISGHGELDDHGNLFLIATNTTHKRLRSTAIPANFIRELMNNCRSETQV